ncbi:VPLPA-CTERM sorting domain-containing protein [Tritonibacter multivorans]|nr:VPLPA-CTERM sorting domain-containing protein [Tritonibacter multivorans]MDA7422761.1 VPLPA-CTERM sorting domain-containing protein [Tritonibacter multivorans]
MKTTVAAAALALLPGIASALSFAGTVAPGSTYNVTDPQGQLVAVGIADEVGGSFSFDVTNNGASTWNFTFGDTFLNNSLPGATFSMGSVVGATGPFSVALAAGETQTLTVFYDDVVRGDVLGARFSAVPLPAGVLLMLSALGGLAVMGRRRNSATAA